MEQVVTALRDCARAQGSDVEGQLLPLAPVERPTVLLGAALAGVAPRPAAQAPLPPLPFPSPLPASPPPAVSRPAPTAPAPAQAPAVSDGPVFSAQAARPVRAVPPAQVASVRPAQAGSPPPLVGPLAVPPVCARVFPRSLIAGAAERQLVAEGRPRRRA